MIPRELRHRSEIVSSELLGLVLAIVKERPSFEGSAADVSIRQALASLASFAGRTELADTAIADLATARAQLEHALATADDDDAKGSVADALAYVTDLRTQAIDRVIEEDRRGSREAVAPSEEFALSLGTPALHRGLPIAVPRLLPTEEETVDEPEPTEDIELATTDEHPQALPPALVAPPLPVALQGDPEERRQVEAHARDVMENIASFASLRRLHDHEAWSDADGFERRLLASFDALLSLARPVDPACARLDLAAELFRYATEWAVPDRGRTFAFAFTLSCVTPDAALLWVTMALRRADPRLHEAYIEALSLGSNPHIAESVVGLLVSDTPRELVLVALEVARRRRIFDAGMMLPLLSQPDSEIAAATARCLPFAPDSVRMEALTSCTADPRPLVRIAGATALVQQGVLGAVEILMDGMARALRARDKPAILAALRALAVMGHPPAADLVWAGAHELQSYREVGFFGHGPHVERLVAVLTELDKPLDAESSPEGEAARIEQSDIAAGAVRRISGIATVRLGSGRYDLAQLRKALGSRSLPPGRLRFGEPIDPRAILKELASPSSAQADRRLLAEELAHHGQGKLRFDVDGWLADQRAFLTTVIEAWNV